MPGGLLNIAAYGAENIILTGNPTKTFFNATSMLSCIDFPFF